MGLLEEREYKGLYQQVCTLHDQAQLLKDLFGNADDLAVLNRCAPGAFVTIRHSLLDGVILGIVRIINDKNRKSLTLTELRKTSHGKAEERELSELLKKLDLCVFTLCEHRNKRIGHYDKDVADGSRVLSPVFVEDIEISLSLIREFMNMFSASNGGPEIGFENGISLGDGKSLVRIVKHGAARIDAIHGGKS